MIELTLPATPEGTAASREVMDALDTAQIEYDAYEEKDGSISFDFGDSDQDAVLDVMRGLGIDVEQQKEDDPQAGEPMYRTESLIDSVRRGMDPGRALEECATCGCGMTEEDPVQAAIKAGYWITKDHGKWSVGRGDGSDSRILSTGHKDKAEARAQMVAAFQQGK